MLISPNKLNFRHMIFVVFRKPLSINILKQQSDTQCITKTKN